MNQGGGITYIGRRHPKRLCILMSNLDNSGHHTRQSGSPGWQKERLTGADEGRETEGAPSNPALAILRIHLLLGSFLIANTFSTFSWCIQEKSVILKV